ncbi:MAG: helix-turn-helix domain-containing protein [Candidatus Binataceae bacterium]
MHKADSIMDAIAPALLSRLENALGELSNTVAQLRAASTSDSRLSEQWPREYLSVKQLAALIPYSEQTIRNLISAGEFQEGAQYYKRRARVVFRWSQVERWLSERHHDTNAGEEPFYPVHHARTRKER